MKVNIGKYKKNENPRTIKIEIDDWDIWNLDHTLAMVIHPALVKFRENLNGHPSQVTGEEWEEIMKRYPLLPLCERRYRYNRDDHADAITLVEYIQLIDAQDSALQKKVEDRLTRRRARKAANQRAYVQRQKEKAAAEAQTQSNQSIPEEDNPLPEWAINTEEERFEEEGAFAAAS